MTIEDIETLVAFELNGKLIEENLHGISSKNIQDYLVKPYKKFFFNPIEDNIEENWVVFDEDRKTEEGYLIFYSEKDKEFGLGTKTNMKKKEDIGTFIGIYGSLVDAISSM